MRNLVCASMVLGVLGTGVSAFDYGVNGKAMSFTKWGFNNQKLNQAEGIAPTDSFTTIVGQLNLNADLGAGFKAGLGGSIAGLAFDSTQNFTQGIASPVVTSYFGVAWDKNKVQNYIVQNAFLEYNFGEHFYLKAGRYESGKVGEYFSGYNQGAEAYVRFSSVKIWGFLSNRRAFAYDQWFNDFYRVHGTYNTSKATRNTYAAGLDLNVGGLLLSAFSYYIPGKVTAPGLSITFDSNPQFEGSGLRSVSKIRSLFPVAASGFYGDNINVRQDQWRGIDKHTASLLIEQKFELNAFNFGAGYYQTFGNANAYIGTWGNPIMLDYWTGNAWDIGQSISDMMGKNAITGFGFFGGKHGEFDWRVIGRGTKSDRSDEQSVALLLNYKVRSDLSVGGKVEWLSDTTKAGYNPLAGYYGSNTLGEGANATNGLTKNRTDDRSHVFFYISHSF